MSIDGTLKYWIDGEPVITDDNPDLIAMKYWKDGEPMGGLVYYSGAAPPAGWTGTINGIPSANIAKINGIPIANISKINGV